MKHLTHAFLAVTLLASGSVASANDRDGQDGRYNQDATYDQDDRYDTRYDERNDDRYNDERYDNRHDTRYDNHYDNYTKEEVMAMNWVGPNFGNYYQEIIKRILTKD